jgi:hypothetical protein
MMTLCGQHHDVDAHSPLGGSVAARVLRCPASVSLAAKVPAHLRKASAYTDRGTALHAAIARLIERECSFGDLVGETIGGYTLTRDDTENALRPTLVCVEALIDQPGAEFYLEYRVAFPTIPGAFGTLDLIVRIGSTVHVIDFKFGSGVRVLALYCDGDEDVINGQLLFYAAAARHSLPKFFAGVDTIVLTILQPTSIELDAELISAVTVTHAELDAFIALYRAACEEALTPAPRLERGDHCRFCPARPVCPAHARPLLDLAQLAAPTPLSCGGAFAAPPAKEAYLQLLADGLDLVDAVKDIGKALHDQAKAALHNGDVVRGYVLTQGRAVRSWHNESDALAALIALGFDRDDLIVSTMCSPKAAEMRAKAHSLKVPSELINSHRSGVSLVRSENAHVPTPGRNELARLYSEALEAFWEEAKYDQA